MLVRTVGLQPSSPLREGSGKMSWIDEQSGQQDRGGFIESQADVPILTSRQREVLVLVEREFTNGQIAVALGMSPSTVKRHLEASYLSLNAHSRVEAVVHALLQGVLRDSDAGGDVNFDQLGGNGKTLAE